jgi:hypothetical protein
MTYTTDMSLFVESTPAVKSKNRNVYIASLAFAAILILMVVAQLFKFETFPDVVVDIWSLEASGLASVYAALIVSLEVTAIPFLLGMRLSPAMRIVSMVAGWSVVLMWLATSVGMNLSSRAYASSGLLGDTLTLPVGWWSVLFCLGLTALAAWVAWGMWPVVRMKRKQ